MHHGGEESSLKQADMRIGIAGWLAKFYGVFPGIKSRVGAALGALAGFRLGEFKYIISGQKIDGTQ